MTLDIQHLISSRFAIVAIATHENGEEDIYAAEGKATYDVATNTIQVYKTGVDEPVIVLQEEEFGDIQIADEEQQEELEAEYFIVVDIDPLEEQ